jgi:hypothetical protein
VLAYVSRYTHRVAIANSRLISADASGVAFKYKDDRIEGPDRYKVMTLEPAEFIRRFLMHVLPKGFHRIRHYGLLANGGVPAPRSSPALASSSPRQAASICHRGRLTRDRATTRPAQTHVHPCPHCGSRMEIIETFEAGRAPRHPRALIIRINTS